MKFHFRDAGFTFYILPSIEITMGSINFCWLYWYFQIEKWWDNTAKLHGKHAKILQKRNKRK